MFVLTRISDVIPVNPELFDADYTKVLVEEIDRKYANKVIADVGLCVTIYDFVHIGDAFVHPSDGTSHSQGTCVYVFRNSYLLCVYATVYNVLMVDLQSSSAWWSSVRSWAKCSRAASSAAPKSTSEVRSTLGQSVSCSYLCNLYIIFVYLLTSVCVSIALCCSVDGLCARYYYSVLCAADAVLLVRRSLRMYRVLGLRGPNYFLTLHCYFLFM